MTLSFRILKVYDMILAFGEVGESKALILLGDLSWIPTKIIEN